MFNSLLFAANDKAPMKINGPNMTEKILEKFPEIKEYFGE